MKLGRIIFTILFICSLFIACDVGIGPRINTKVPDFNIPEEGIKPGDFIIGNDSIRINLYHPFAPNFIAEAYMTIEFYCIDSDCEANHCKPHIAKIDGVPDIDARNAGDPDWWLFSLDTAKFTCILCGQTITPRDGNITTYITATDKDGVSTTTTPLVYKIKNTPPEIELTIPTVKGTDFDQNTEDLTAFLLGDPVFVGFDLMGLATDDLGVAEGFPKIQIWPADQQMIDGEPVAAVNKKWFSMIKPNDVSGLTATRVSWPMVELIPDASNPEGYRLPEPAERKYLEPKDYRFRIWTRDLNGRDNFYPNRTNSTKQADAYDHEHIVNAPCPHCWIQVKFISAEFPIIQPEETPQYFNAARDFESTVYVNSAKPLTHVKAWITMVKRETLGGETTETQLGTTHPIEPNLTDPNQGYDLVLVSGNLYKLVVPEAVTRTWPVPAGANVFYVNYWAKDMEDKDSPSSRRAFTLDQIAPSVNIDRPVTIPTIKKDGNLSDGKYSIYYPMFPNPRWVTGNVVVGGMPKDESGVVKVYYHLGNLFDDDPSLTDAQRETIYNNAPWIDTEVHNPVPITKWSGTPYAWSYTDNFNGYKNEVYSGSAPSHLIGRKLAQEHTDLALGMAGYEGHTTTGQDRFYLPFYVKVLDGAGNRHVVQYKLCIDPNLDIPYADIGYPAIDPLKPSEKPMVGGAVRISGTATDNIAVHSVQIRIRDLSRNTWYIPTGLSTTYPSLSASLPGTGDTEGWFNATISGDGTNVSWFVNVNRDTLLNPIGNTGNVRIEVRAVDWDELRIAPNRVGPAQTLEVVFSNLIPQIRNAKINKTGIPSRDFADGMRISGSVEFSMTISDGDSINNVMARLGSGAYIDLVKDGSTAGLTPPSGWVIGGQVNNTSNPSDPRVERNLTVPINSLDWFNYGNTGMLNFDIIIENRRDPPLTANISYSFGVDNFYPSTEIQTITNASGASFDVKGIAKDYQSGSGPIQGLDHVLVYFEKAEIFDTGIRIRGTGDFYNQRGYPNLSSSNSSPTKPRDDPFYTGHPEWNVSIPRMTTRSNVRDTMTGGSHGASFNPNNQTPNIASFNNFPVLALVDKGGNIGEVWESPHAMVISRQELGDSIDSDKDGTFGEVWDGMVDKEWQAKFTSNGAVKEGVVHQPFADGPYIVHYIVMDQAGNATHYSKDIYIENNKPIIKTFTVGTDINNNNSVEPYVNENNTGEYLNLEAVNSVAANNRRHVLPFRIRNNRFGIRLEIAGGNGLKRYSVNYVEAGASIAAASMIRGNIYSIAPGSGGTDFTQFGALSNNEGTVFIASGPGTGTGRVIPYTTPSNVTPKRGDFTASATITDYIQLTASDFTNIPDSVNFTANERHFMIKVYDTTIAGRPEADQLAHAVLIAVNIENLDQRPPSVEIQPFYWNSETNNSLYNNSKTEGHIDIGTDLPSGAPFNSTGIYDRDDKVSGRVSFRGTMTDNNIIRSVYININGHDGGYGSPSGTTTDIPATISNTATGNITHYLAARYNGSSWEQPVSGSFANNGWQFTVVSETLGQEGHTLNWKLDYDSSKISGTARADNVLSIIARDARSTPNISNRPTHRFDVVPFIREIKTSLSGAMASIPSTFNRSATGWYPVRENENIDIIGFNLTGAGANLNGALTVNSTTSTNANVNIGTAASGDLSVIVNGISSLNNINNKDTPYNQEPNGINNNKLTNERKLYVWKIDYIDNTNTSHVSTPFFRMDKDGNRLLTYGYFPATGASGGVRVVRNGTNYFAYNATTGNPNRQINTTIGIGNNNTSWYTASSDISAVTGNWGLRFTRSPASGTGTANSAIGTVTAIAANLGTDTDRYKIPRIAVQSTNTSGTVRTNANTDRILMSYFDNDAKEIRVIYGNVQADGVTNIPGTIRTVASDTVTTARPHSGSMYVTAGFLKNGLPVLAWYDRNKQNLVLSWGSDTPSTTGTTATARVDTTNDQWQSNAVIIDSGKGAHVDMAVDEDNTIHLAYYDVSNGGLYYARIPATGIDADRAIRPNVTKNTSNVATNVTPVKVDTYLSAGTKIMINVRKEGSNYVPYITYAHASFAETKNAVRIAWKNNKYTGSELYGADDKDMFTGAWEVMTVPAANLPDTAHFICNGVPTGTSGWTSGTNRLTGTGINIDKTVLVTYMTDVHYEGAVLKHNIY